MSFSDVIERWGAVESDFQRFYHVKHPLRLSWRKFKVLLFNLASEESAFFAPFIKELREEAETDRKWQDYKRGDRANIPRTSISLDDALKDLGMEQ